MPLVRKDNPAVSPPTLEGAKLTAVLERGSSDERWKAARDAIHAADGPAILQKALVNEKDAKVREAIFTTLARIATPESALVVLPYLRSDDSQQRTEAIDALRAMPAAAGPLLPQLLSDADPDVRLLSCEIVRSQPSDDASRLLGDLLIKESHPNVCAAAIEVLAEAGSKADLSILAQCATRFPADPFLAFAIDEASKRIGSR